MNYDGNNNEGVKTVKKVKTFWAENELVAYEEYYWYCLEQLHWRKWHKKKLAWTQVNNAQTCSYAASRNDDTF